MKKLFAILMALTLCVGALSVAAFAADYQFVSVTGTMNEWNPGAESGKMTEISENVYSLTFQNMAAGEHKFKFTANGNWNDLNLGGAFMGSAVEADLYWSGADIVINVAEACDVTIQLDLTGFDASAKTGAKFTVTIGDQVDAPRGDIKIHISVPEGWGDVYAYVWGPEHLGSWPGTKVENGTVELPAAFDGFIVNNNAGTQTSDIKDIDLTKEEVWVVVADDNSYALYYNEADVVIPQPTPTIKIHVIAPESWAEVYAYTFNPAQCGNWPGVLVENGYIEIPASFEGFIVNNNAGVQTADIKDIDLTQAEVWVVVAEDGSYTLSYEEPQAPVEPSEPETQPTEPETQPTEPETQPTEPETQPTEPETQPTEPETQPTQPENPETPDTGDVIGIVVAMMAAAGMALIALRKKEI